MRCEGLCDYVSSYTSHRLIFKRLMNNVESKPLYHSAMALRKLGRKIRELGFPVPFRKHFSYTRAISVFVDLFLPSEEDVILEKLQEGHSCYCFYS